MRRALPPVVVLFLLASGISVTVSIVLFADGGVVSPPCVATGGSSIGSRRAGVVDLSAG